MSNLAIKKVAVVGAGSVGSALANSIKVSGKAGSVVVAARDPAKTKGKLAEDGLNLEVEDSKSAIASSDILILATTSMFTDAAIEEFAKSLGDVSGKVIIDATNPLSEFQDGLQVRWEQGTSAGETLQKFLPSAFVYKSFNTLGFEHMKAGNTAGKDMLFCGSAEAEPLALATATVAAVGYNPYYVGPIRYARNLEAIAELWIHCAIPPLPGTNMGRDWTFAISGNPLNKPE